MAARALFTLTIFVGSALLFLVQPMVAKMILPSFGGAPSVWNAAMVFFQAALLLGYGYAHASVRWLGVRRQPFLHLAVLLAALLFLPVSLPAAGEYFGISDPAIQVLSLLAWVVGVPFFAVAAGAPLLQRWFAATRAKDAPDPYFLYSASNLGSMVALLAYPFAIEPALTLTTQAQGWTMGYAALVALTGLCAVYAMRSNEARVEQSPTAEETQVRNIERLRWVGLSAAPSALLLGVTLFLTTNVAPMPLLWVVPLALYLLSFILAFAAKRLVAGAALARLLPLLVIPLGLAIIFETSDPIEPVAFFHLLVFFVAAWTLHRLLNESRPGVRRLTEFYLWIAVGGVAGGVFSALLAPVIFDTVFEYPLALCAALALLPRRDPEGPRVNYRDFAYPALILGVALAAQVFVDRLRMPTGPITTAITLGLPLVLAFIAVARPLRLGLSLLAVFLAAHLTRHIIGSNTLFLDRSFFGVLRVASFENGAVRTLVHGNTQHGEQNFNEDLRSEPMSYYHRSGPIGQVFRRFSGPRMKRSVGVVGLGVGSLAAYGEVGQSMSFYEIDPLVVHIARDTGLFTFLRDSKASIRVVLGDGRLSIAKEPNASMDLLVLDAFSSDAIPVHLLTREAFQLYLEKLRPGGLLAIHVSNRYLDLEPVLRATADSLQLKALHQHDFASEDEEKAGKKSSQWMLFARDGRDFGRLDEVPWLPARRDEGVSLWTDDYTNILSAYLARRQAS